MMLYDIDIKTYDQETLPIKEERKHSDIILLNPEKQHISVEYNKPFKDGIRCTYNKCGCRVNPLVWVSDKLQAIYFEIPKVASTSMKSYLDLPSFGYQQTLVSSYFLSKKYDAKIMLDKTFNILSKALLKYNLAQLNSGKNALEHTAGILSRNGFYPYYKSIDQKSDYFKFTFIRSPFDRMVSNWAMFNQKPARKKILQHQLNQTYDDLSFEEFLNISQHTLNHHWQPQVAFLPKHALQNLNFIGNMEHMKRDLERLSHSLNIEFDQKRIANKTSHRKYNELLNSDQLEQLATIYFEDIQLYEQVNQVQSKSPNS